MKVYHLNCGILHTPPNPQTIDDHPVSALTTLRAEDDRLRRTSLAALRRISQDPSAKVELFGYHDLSEFPPGTSGASQTIASKLPPMAS